MSQIIKTEKEYRAHKAMNFSSLSEFDSSPKWYFYNKQRHNPHDGDRSYFHIGSALDCIMTDGMDQFKKDFVVGTVTSPTGNMRTFCDTFVHCKIDGLDDDTSIHQAYVKSGYKIKVDRVKTKLAEGVGRVYIKEKLAADKKTYLTKDEGELVQRMYNKVQENPKINYYFSRKDEDSVERKFQFPILFTVNGIECKALLDLLFIDHKEKKVYPIDLKTTGKSTAEFAKSFVSFRYYLQAAFYTEAVRQWMVAQSLIGICDYSKYTLEPFQFAVVSKSGYEIPFLFKTTPYILACGRDGGILKSNGEYRRGYVKLLDDYQWHTANKYWETPRELFESQHTVTLDVFK